MTDVKGSNSGDNPNKKDGDQNEQIPNQQKSSIDKLTITEFIRFAIYAISFILIISMHEDVPEASVANQSFINEFLNFQMVDGTAVQVNSSKLDFSSIAVLDDITNFTFVNIIDGIYDEGKGFYNTVPQPFRYFVIFTPLRFRQTRASIAPEPSGIVPYRWTDDQTIDSTNTYGFNNSFTYKASDGNH